MTDAQSGDSGQRMPGEIQGHEAATTELLSQQFGDGVVEVTRSCGQASVVLQPHLIRDACRLLRDAPGLRYNFLVDVTAVDWLEREPRFDVVYHLLSLETRATIRLKVRVGTDEEVPEVPSVVPVWDAANFYEREVFDLFGIRFTDHPDLRRILMPSDWVGYPLRKDYPTEGYR